MSASVIVVIPIYKTQLDILERQGLDYSLTKLSAKKVLFIGPSCLDRGFYQETYPELEFVAFDDECFASIAGYNRLLLSESFYQRFAEDEFLLILQTDAIILRDDLDYWCAQPFDYIGAPWPDGVEVYLNLGRFLGDKGKRVRAIVGNGGLSLRRIKKCIALLHEFPEAVDVFIRSGSNEDLFFSLMGLVSNDFLLPNEITASRFATEIKPSYYYSVNGEVVPMGGHAWTLYEKDFWLAHMELPNVN